MGEIVKSSGATFGKATPHQALAVILGDDISLFDFVKAGKILCQVSDIRIQSNLGIDDAKAIARGKKKIPLHDVIAKLDVLIRRSQPIMPGSIIKLATKKDILEFLLGKTDPIHCINIGQLLRRKDVKFYLGGEFLNNHLAILGMIGTGKSNAGKIIMSQVNWKGAKVVIVDPHAEYKDGKIIDVFNLNNTPSSLSMTSILNRMRDELPEKQGKVLDKVIRIVKHSMQDESMESYIKVCDDEYVHGGSRLHDGLMDAIWTESAINEITIQILGHNYSIPLIFNLKGINKLKAQTLVKVISDLILNQGKMGAGSYLFIDEAQTYVPQKGTPDCKTSIIDLITEGRKFNCGVVLMSQRPARVDKDVLSQCNSKIILKLTNENDIKQVRASTEFSTKQMFDEVQKLRKGEALMVSASMERPVFIKVDKYEGKNS